MPARRFHLARPSGICPLVGGVSAEDARPAAGPAWLQGCPHHRITRSTDFKESVRVMNDLYEVVQPHRRLPPIAPERRTARNCARPFEGNWCWTLPHGRVFAVWLPVFVSWRSGDARHRTPAPEQAGPQRPVWAMCLTLPEIQPGAVSAGTASPPAEPAYATMCPLWFLLPGGGLPDCQSTRLSVQMS